MNIATRKVVDPARYGRITNEAGIQQNHVTLGNGDWHRTAPVTYVPEGRRPPAAGAPGGQQPAGTIRPSEVARPMPRPEPGRPGPGGARPAEAPGPGRALAV